MRAALIRDKELPTQLFNSFWIAGFESATHINKDGTRLDMLASVQHDKQVMQDYALLRSIGVRTARDGIRWNLVDHGGNYDFSSLEPMVQAAEANDIQVIWNLCHYGWPDDIDLFSPAFIDRFAKYSRAVAQFLHDRSDDPPFFVPINEISFFSWAVGCACMFYPYSRGRDNELKRHLVRAAIAGMEAIWEVDPRARFCHVDPIIHVVQPRNRPELAQASANQHESQYESWDMLAGRAAPELGGHPKYLDIIGVNYYHSNQWEHPDVRLRWEDAIRDERWLPLHLMFSEVYNRYHRPIFMAETSHFGVGRARWLREIAVEMYLALERGIPMDGICIYPILDRHDWENPNHWHNSGLFDLEKDKEGNLVRVLNEIYAAALRDAQHLLSELGCY